MNKKILGSGLLWALVVSADAPELSPLVSSTSQPPLPPIESSVLQELNGPETPLKEAFPPAQEEALDEETEIMEPGEDDIMELPEYARGNWYEKQRILRQAHDVYQEVRQKDAQVRQSEESFITQKNKFINELEEFSQKTGTTLAQVVQRLQEKIEQLESQPQATDQKTAQERVKNAQSQEMKNDLIKLNKDIASINELYKLADDGTARLMQLITDSHAFEQKAFESYEKISHVLSDQVAEQLYTEIVTARENIEGILAHIKGEFTHFFEELSTAITRVLADVQQQLTTLENQGMNILKAAPEPVAPAAQPLPVEKQKNIFVRFGASIGAILVSIWAWVRSFFV